MTAIVAIRRPNLSALFETAARHIQARRTAARVDRAEEDRARRDFINDAIRRNPDAFASDHDVQAMMYMYSAHF